MKLITRCNNIGYYIDLDNGNWIDDYIAKQLGLELEDYHKILKKYNAFCKIIINNKGDCYFYSQSDAEKAIEELEPYLILATLTN